MTTADQYQTNVVDDHPDLLLLLLLLMVLEVVMGMALIPRATMAPAQFRRGAILHFSRPLTIILILSGQAMAEVTSTQMRRSFAIGHLILHVMLQVGKTLVMMTRIRRGATHFLFLEVGV